MKLGKRYSKKTGKIIPAVNGLSEVLGCKGEHIISMWKFICWSKTMICSWWWAWGTSMILFVTSLIFIGTYHLCDFTIQLETLWSLEISSASLYFYYGLSPVLLVFTKVWFSSWEMYVEQVSDILRRTSDARDWWLQP